MGKKVLVVGSGGREHALAWKLAQSPEVSQVFVAPGNAGTIGSNVPISATNVPALLSFALKQEIDLTVVGPENSLTLGIADAFSEKGLKIFGPSRAASRLEGSKAFAKEIMKEAGVPTAESKVFTDSDEAKAYVNSIGAPCVLKADGLAAGKGVIVAMDLDTALNAIDEIMDGGAFGASGNVLLVEEYLEGQEVSLLCLTDGENAIPLAPVQDHKRALDGDEGLNTGGMGTYSPPPFWNQETEDYVMEKVVLPTLKVMKERETPFIGVLFVGLMLTKSGPKVLEFNARFGDPEAQAVMVRLESDLFEALLACTEGRLKDIELKWKDETSVCVVMASPGYPGSYTTGTPIYLPVASNNNGVIFHAGTSVSENGELVSAGGRVLGVTALGSSLKEARENAYNIVKSVEFPDAHYRNDIGIKGL